MIKNEIESIILNYLLPINPEWIGIFGSYSRGDSDSSSDLDILIKLKDAVSLFQIIKIENELTEKTGIKIDLISEGSLKNKKIKSSIFKDLQIIYER